MAESSYTVANSSEEYNEEEGNTITMLDVLEEEQKLEEDANAVLGGSDDKNCTFSEVGFFLLSILFHISNSLYKTPVILPSHS